MIWLEIRVGIPINGEKPLFDQQPIEAGYLTQAYVSAYEIVQKRKYLELAKYSFEYFLGRNRLQTVMYDYSTGAVCDGLNSDGMNCNQGAESVICLLMALSSLKKHENKAFSTRLKPRVSDEADDLGSAESKEYVISKSDGMRKIT